MLKVDIMVRLHRKAKPHTTREWLSRMDEAASVDVAGEHELLYHALVDGGYHQLAELLRELKSYAGIAGVSIVEHSIKW